MEDLIIIALGDNNGIDHMITLSPNSSREELIKAFESLLNEAKIN